MVENVANLPPKFRRFSPPSRKPLLARDVRHHLLVSVSLTAGTQRDSSAALGELRHRIDTAVYEPLSFQLRLIAKRSRGTTMAPSTTRPPGSNSMKSELVNKGGGARLTLLGMRRSCDVCGHRKKKCDGGRPCRYVAVGARFLRRKICGIV